MSKYEPLEVFLNAQQTVEVPMTFEEIERVLGFRLPPRASGHRAWWSNNPSNNVMTKAWLAAGFETERVDMGSRRLVFRRRSKPGRAPTPAASPPSAGFLDQLRSRMAGTVTIPPGADIITPTGEPWDADR